MLVALKSAVDEEVLWSWFDSCVEQRDWQACLGMLSAVAEKQIKSDPRLTNFRSWLLEQLSSSRGEICAFVSIFKRVRDSGLRTGLAVISNLKIIFQKMDR